MVTDTVADVLTRIRNAQRARHRVVGVPAVKVVLSTLEVLKTEGFIESYQTLTKEGEKFPSVEITLKYFRTGDPAIRVARRMSKPGRRHYVRSQELKPISSGLGVSIVSTSQGMMSDREARKRNIGGELVAVISC